MSRGLALSFRSKFGSKSGFTLVQGIVGILIVTAAAVLFASVVSYYRSYEVRLDDRVGIQNILLESVSEIRAIPFDDLVAFCTAKGAINTSALNQSPCFNSNTPPNGLSNDPSIIGATTASGVQKPIEVLKNISTGRASLSGSACVALDTCKVLIPGQLIEVELAGIWMDPNSRKSPPYNITRQIFRRVRW